MRSKHKYLICLVLAFLFFAVSLFTLKDYGISWDEPIHFIRGQAYLNYFLTGKTTYDGIKLNSSYEYTSYDAKFFFSQDSGHPPLNGILAAFTNLIFFQKLHLLGDIQAYQLFNILVSSLLVFVVSVFAFETIGLSGAIFSSLALIFYPLFFAESHFNIKDPAETAFYALSIWAFWKSLNKFNWKWLLISGISVGLAFSTKFNILFLPFILVPYLIYRYRKKYFKTIRKLPLKYVIVLFLCPIIVITIFVATWPFLWHDPIGNFMKIFAYYKQIGTGFDYQHGYFVNGFNLYAIVWILVTTPPVILLFSALGFFSFFQKRNEYVILWFIWLIVPILRVTIPGTSIYGGVRQIMEFLPALALIFALGATYFFSKVIRKVSFLKLILLVGVIFFVIFPVLKYHPNENVYFNFLIGGLKGAKQVDIPSWGNSFGNAYLPAINFLNKNAEQGARLALIEGTGTNVSKTQLRDDIVFSNDIWSGINRKGEYLMELTYNENIHPYPYAWDYVNNVLDPVYEVKVDGVSIAKLWKNDVEHSKPQFKVPEKIYSGPMKAEKTDNQVVIDLGRDVNLSRFVGTFNRTKTCDLVSGDFYISSDHKTWKQQMSPLSEGQIPGVGIWQDKKTNDLVYLFPGSRARYIRFDISNNQKCFLASAKYKVFVLE